MNRADALVIVAPEHNHGYPGPLKHVLDTNLKEYVHKAAGIVGVSAGVFGGARVIQNLISGAAGARARHDLLGRELHDRPEQVRRVREPSSTSRSSRASTSSSTSSAGWPRRCATDVASIPIGGSG